MHLKMKQSSLAPQRLESKTTLQVLIGSGFYLFLKDARSKSPLTPSSWNKVKTASTITWRSEKPTFVFLQLMEQSSPSPCVAAPSRAQYRVLETWFGYTSKATAIQLPPTRDSRPPLLRVCILQASLLLPYS